ncbi:MAG: bifunctional tRNA (5-methylaminomethyl-2-thiouridine)(34)-methyltransferase MnmD/FAD-dependent 5-carboxymethylaminomethyl-2-thiouridine(34) oxidoreductase MnmC [Halioglobus sp.]
MNRDNTPWTVLPYASVDWSLGDTPKSTAFEDVYFSSDNGLAESRYVFLDGNSLPERWDSHHRSVFTIAETGFGAGLNFLLAWQALEASAAPRPRLHFISVEKYPLSPDDLARALAPWLELSQYAEALLAQYPLPIRGNHRLLFDDGRVVLDLWFEDGHEWLEDLASRKSRIVDAWFLDGFTPARNESLWSAAVLNAVARLSHPSTTLATFTAAGQVRRDLEAAGFTMSKAAGFGRKRECSRGVFAGSADTGEKSEAPLSRRRRRQQTAAFTPWDLPQAAQQQPESVIVLGAGLAGCTAAYALATRGISVKLLDRYQVASAASGNEQGVLYTRFSNKHSSLTDFALQSYSFAHRWYHTQLEAGQLRDGEDGALCGCFQQMPNAENLAKLSNTLATIPELASFTSADEAETLLGVKPAHDGLWLPDSGWINPAALCRTLVSHPLISLHENCGELELSYKQKQWFASSESHTFAAHCAIIATGCEAGELHGLSWLPTRAIRGQTTRLPASNATHRLKAAFCHEGYIAPAQGENHCIGATFDLHSDDSHVQIEDHQRNLDALGRATPLWEKSLGDINAAQLTGRTGFRCASPDYLPLAGPVPELTPFLAAFSDLRDNARRHIDQCGHYQPGLYLTVGHGSRGLTSTPLCAELLASTICGELSPLSRELSRAVAPARFLIRDLIRQKR